MSHSATPPKTNTSRCLSLYINSRPPVFTKCLFNENCFVSSLSEHLMAHVLLQVPETNRDIWPWKAEPRTKTKEHAHTHVLTHTCARPQTLCISAFTEYLANPEVQAISLASLAPMTNRNSVGC